MSHPRLTSLPRLLLEHRLCPPAPLHSMWPSNCCVAPRKGDLRGELVIDVIEVFVFSLIFLLYCGSLDATRHVQMRGQPAGSVLSLCHVGPKDRTEGKHPYLLSHLTGLHP